MLYHYYEVTKNDRTYMTWGNNPKKENLEDGCIALEFLVAKLLDGRDGTHDGNHAAEMPPPFTSKFPYVATLPLASQPPVLGWGHIAHGHVSQPFPWSTFSYSSCS
jgi:hypothetical protein